MKKKLTIAITGHRDIIETEKLRHDVKAYFEKLIEENETVEIRLLSPLADGADRFVAKVFLELHKEHKHLSLIVPMPFDLERYLEDFDEVSSKEFMLLKEEAEENFEVPRVSRSGYLDVGRYVVDESDILLALWDGTFNGKIGGTGDVVTYAKDMGCEVLHFLCERGN